MDPRPSYASTADFLRRLSGCYRHTEGVAECLHCNVGYAATVLAGLAQSDDDEPVTVDWLREIGAKYNGTKEDGVREWLMQFPPSAKYFRFAFDGDGWGLDIVDISSEQSQTLLVDRSRGDVRRLFQAMGIQVTF